MNLGKDFLAPKEKGVSYSGDPWVPATPHKPDMWDSNPTPIGMQGNQRSMIFPDLVHSSTRLLPEKPVLWRYPFSHPELLVNQRASSSLEALIFGENNLSPDRSVPRSSETNGAGRRGNPGDNANWQEPQGIFGTLSPKMQIPSSAPGMQGIRDSTNWQELMGVYSGLLQQTTPSNAFQNVQSTGLLNHGGFNLQGNPVVPNQGNSSSNLQQMSNDAYPMLNQHSYNLNFPPAEVVGASTSCFQIAPVTPDKGKQAENQQQASTIRQEAGNSCEKLMQSGIASESSNSIMEKNVAGDVGFEGIDLNKTPQQKTPRRKKHRPKVVVEGKQRRTPKPTPSTTQPSNEKPSGKKKYVRRKGQGSTSSAQDSEAQPVEVPGVQSGAKTCKRMLNFDVEGKMQEKTGDNQPESRNESFDLNLTSQGTSSSMGSNREFTIPAAKIEQKKRYSAETQQGKKPFDLMNSTNQKSTQRFLPLHPIAPTATARDHTLNVIARTIKQTATTYQNNDQYGYFQVPLQENGASDKQLMLQTRIRSAEGTAEANMERGRKRDYCNISDLKYSPTVNCGVQVSSSPYTNGRWPYSNVETVGNNFKKQRPLSGLKLHRDYMAGPLFLQDTESHHPSLLTGITGQNMLSPPQRVPETNQANETTSPKINKVVKRQMVGLESSLLPFSKEKVLSKDYKKEIGYSPFSGKPREFGAGQNEEQKHATEVEEIICQLKGLQISNSARAVVREGKTALVPYKADGTIVPHEEFNPIRRRKPRPKVDLDPETNRLWDLLMVKPVSESTETMDKDKELWWEDQRKVFRGRVDSFIARMHLLQGDRRFSRWKGSVVDSVVGVFLTQNVSDHLSSSAFMSLAAKFPPRTMPNQTSAWVEEPEVQIIDPDGTITYHGEIQRQPLYKYNSMYELSEQRSDHLISGGVHLGKENNRVTEEEVFSSQNSSESLILQANEDVQSSSDSEVQDQVIMCDANKSHSPKSILQMGSPSKPLGSESSKIPNSRKRKLLETKKSFDWDSLRKQVPSKGGNQKRDQDKMDSLDYEALRQADVRRISETIRERGMNNMLAERIKDFLNRLVRDHGSIDLEWLRDVPPDKAKDYLLSIRGLGLKSVECVRLLTLHHMAFPVDTNVGRIAVRLGWVPLQPLPESLQLHLLELYPVLESIQKYIWPRLCKLDQRTLYELHYQMITFGKVFCTKKNPNCNVCPMRPECRHFASAFASARLALPGPEEKSIVTSTSPMAASGSPPVFMPLLEEWIVNSTIPMAGKESTPAFMAMLLAPPETDVLRQSQYISSQQEPIIEEPSTPEISTSMSEVDIEDMSPEGTDEIPTIDLSIEQLRLNVESILQERNMEITGDLSRALVALNPANAYIPAPKLKNVSRLRTEHQVYEIPDSHQLLERMDRREPDDPSPYLLAIWTPGETANSTEPPESKCSSQETGRRCNEKTCSACDRIREAKSQTVRGTLLIPCRTAMRGSFPLNGTYFQVNEVFADHETSNNPIEVPRDWLWSLPRRTVYFGTSVSTIFKGLSQIEIQYCFWKGFVCVRGFERETRAPKPLVARLHFPASKKVKSKNEKQ